MNITNLSSIFQQALCTKKVSNIKFQTVPWTSMMLVWIGVSIMPLLLLFSEKVTSIWLIVIQLAWKETCTDTLYSSLSRFAASYSHLSGIFKRAFFTLSVGKGLHLKKISFWKMSWGDSLRRPLPAWAGEIFSDRAEVNGSVCFSRHDRVPIMEPFPAIPWLAEILSLAKCQKAGQT